MLISIWVYAYSQGIASARAIERSMVWEPALRWLAADQSINHHTLSDFRMGQKERLDGLFVKILAVLQSAGLVDLQTLLQDGTKVRAPTGKQSFHRRKSLEEHCAEAQQALAELEQRGEPEAGDDRRCQAAREELTQRETETAAEVRDAPNDTQELLPAVERVSRSAGACVRPGIAEEFRPAAFVHDPASDTLSCPRGRYLALVKIRQHHGVSCNVYQASAADCQACEVKLLGCPRSAAGRQVERVIESEAMQSFQRLQCAAVDPAELEAAVEGGLTAARRPRHFRIERG